MSRRVAVKSWTQGLALVLLGATVLSGCRQSEPEERVDAAFLRANPEPSPLAPPAASLFPMDLGRIWIMDAGPVDPQTQEFAQKPLSETTTAIGVKRVGKVTGAGLRIRDANGAVREEVYQVDSEGIRQVSAGASDRIDMVPPATILGYPLVPEKISSWQGDLVFQGKTIPGRMWSRLRGIEKVRVPAGEFDAYRVDTVLVTNIDGHEVAFPTWRWIAPGVGLVKVRFALGDRLYQRVLTDNKPRSHSGLPQKKPKI